MLDQNPWIINKNSNRCEKVDRRLITSKKLNGHFSRQNKNVTLRVVGNFSCEIDIFITEVPKMEPRCHWNLLMILKIHQNIKTFYETHFYWFSVFQSMVYILKKYCCIYHNTFMICVDQNLTKFLNWYKFPSDILNYLKCQFYFYEILIFYRIFIDILCI